MMSMASEVPDRRGRSVSPGLSNPGVCAALVLVFLVTGCGEQTSTTNTAETRPAGAGSDITLHTPQGDVKAYVARPQGTGPFPGVIVVHEWWGLNPQIRGVADRLAAQGYVAIAPDLYHGRVAVDPEKAHELMRGVSAPAAVADLRAAAAELRASPQVGQKPVGILGFCMGGGLALQTALSGEPLQACAIFYGAPLVTDRTQLKKMPCPVLAMFGAEDEGLPADTVRAFQQALTDDGKKAEVKIYDKAGHAFMNETRPSYRPEAAADAWSRLQKFLADNLKP